MEVRDEMSMERNYIVQDRRDANRKPAPLPSLFDGPHYSDQHDAVRLSGQLARVFETMRDQVWRTVPELADIIGGSHTGISARLRDLRKVKFGGHNVDSRRRGDADAGVWEYRLRVSQRFPDCPVVTD